MPSQVPVFEPGQRLIAGDQLNTLVALLFGTQSGITAHAGGGQANGVPLTQAVNEVSVCATTSDSVVLPPAQTIGQTVTVINNGAQTLAVFAAPSTDQIMPNNSVTANANGTAATLATTKIGEFFCY